MIGRCLRSGRREVLVSSGVQLIVDLQKDVGMITMYEFSGCVRGTDRHVQAYCSAPTGITVQEFSKRLEGFLTAFDNVSVKEVKGK